MLGTRPRTFGNECVIGNKIVRLGTRCNTGGSWEHGWERPIFPVSSVLFHFLGLFQQY